MQESEFTAAMERAVALRGGDYIYPDKKDGLATGHYTTSVIGTPYPTYSDEGGEGTCLIGVAIQMLGMPVPAHRENRGADAVLTGMGFTQRVGMAGRMAQMHQDARKPWAEALAVYKQALLIQHEADRAYTPFRMFDLYYEAVYRATGERATDLYSSFPTIAVTAKKGGIQFTASWDELGETTKKVTAQMEKTMQALTETQKKVAAFVENLDVIDTSVKPIEVTVPEVPKFATGGIVSGSIIFPENIVGNPGMMFHPAGIMASPPTFTWTGSAIKKGHALAA